MSNTESDRRVDGFAEAKVRALFWPADECIPIDSEGVNALFERRSSYLQKYLSAWLDLGTLSTHPLRQDMAVMELWSAAHWRAHAYPVFQVSPALAVSLSLTDPPQSEIVRSPFPVIGVRADVVTPMVFEGLPASRFLAHSFVHGAKRCMQITTWVSDPLLGIYPFVVPVDSDDIPGLNHETARHRLKIRDFVLNLAAYLTYSKTKIAEPRPGWEKRKKGYRITEVGSRATPIPGGTSAPRSLLASANGRPLSSRHVVRGHWRQQPHGPARSERRLQWIEPHWRGPEDGPEKSAVYDVRPRKE